MIPIKMQLKNFLSYGSEIQTIDFSTYSLICLSGKNGHGKSALLDALTWALWGQARKISATTKADQGLVRLGHTQMMVVLDFECAGQVYRIRREYMITYGKPYAILEFGVLNPHTNCISSLTDKTIRDTQEKIEKTIRIDFNSFCNSAFLRQGNANEFSQKSPKDRKEILATILGLNHYDILKKRALEKAKTASLEYQALEVIQKKCELELKEQEALLQELHTLEKTIHTLNEEEQLGTITRDAIAADLALVQKEKEKLTIVSITAQQQLEKKVELQKQKDALMQQWTIIDQAKNNIENLQELKDKHTATIKKIMEHQKILQETLNQKEQLLTLKEKLHQLNQEHHQALATGMQEKNKEIEHFDLELTNKTTIQKSLAAQTEALTKELEYHNKEYAELQQHVVSVQIDETLYATLKNKFEKRKLFYHNFLSQGTFASNELEQLKKKVILADDDNAPSCALCEQNLSASRKRFLKNKFLHTKKTITHRIQRLKKIVEKLKQLLVQDHKQLELYNQQKEQLAIVTIRLEQTTKLIVHKEELIIHNTNEYNLYEEIITQQKQKKISLQAEQEAFVVKQTQLFTKSPMHTDTKNAIHKIEAFLQHNPYYAQEHQDAQKELDLLEQKITEYQEIQKKLNEQTQIKEKIETITTQLNILHQEIAQTTNIIDSYNYITTTENSLLERKKTQEQQEKKYADQKNELLEQRGALNTKKTRLAQTAQEYAEHQKILATLEQTKKDYLAIALATGKDGIQALLIENAIPEIEQEANNLLAKLTNNQSHILIESLRDLKKGGTKETLDIKISDAYGIRPYEMFSGGEAFRIDFALRVAISKLLARRAGTSLQTLIIDEGFGSQDEEGLSYIMDALHKIQDDFSKIIIVSHLTSMKEQFPVHFFINKGPNGSVVTVLEQD